MNLTKILSVLIVLFKMITIVDVFFVWNITKQILLNTILFYGSNRESAL